MSTLTFTIKLAGRTEEVEFSILNDRFGISKPIFAARIGRGVKLYSAQAHVWKFDTVADARKRGYWSDQIRTLDNGEVWAIQLSDTVRNRQAYIVAFADDYVGTDLATKHNDYSALRPTNTTKETNPS